MKLVVDYTPTFVNRTAIYHIALDTVAALRADFDVSLQVRGEALTGPPDGLARSAVTSAFLSDLEVWSRDSVHLDEIDPMPVLSDATSRLYFDPIYTLFRPLGPRDVVMVLDLSTLTNPEWHNPMVAKMYERSFRRLSGSPVKLVSISHHCTALLRASFSIPAQDIVTVPLYLRDLVGGPAQPPSTELTPKRFFLCVGSLELRKNLIGLIQAFALSGLVTSGWSLVIAGGPGLGADTITALADSTEGVELLGFVPDSELRWLYQNAAAFAYPSFLEGFGLPLLEAMAYGLPCLASSTGASSEVIGDLGRLVDPYRVPDIVDALVAMAKEAGEEGFPAGKLRERASAFTFEAYYKELLDVLQRSIA